MTDRDFQDDVEMIVIGYHYQVTLPPKVSPARIMNSLRSHYPDLSERVLLERTLAAVRQSSLINSDNIRQLTLNINQWRNTLTGEIEELSQASAFNFKKPSHAWIWFLNGPGAGEWYTANAIANNIHTRPSCHFGMKELIGVRRSVHRFASRILINKDADDILYKGADDAIDNDESELLDQ